MTTNHRHQCLRCAKFFDCGCRLPVRHYHPPRIVDLVNGCGRPDCGTPTCPACFGRYVLRASTQRREVQISIVTLLRQGMGVPFHQAEEEPRP